MKTEALGLEHQEILSNRLARMKVGLSEYTFANLYLFRKIHDYQLLKSPELFITGKTRDGFAYIMPTIPYPELDFNSLARLLTEYKYLFPVPEEFKDLFHRKNFLSFSNEADSDYLYSREKLASYPGRQLAGRRNLARQFMRQYSHRSADLSPNNCQDALKALLTWKNETNQDLNNDFQSCLEALQLFERLALKGTIYYVEDKPVGFLMGEPLTSEIYVLHFAKADTSYKGIYQFMYQNFAQNLEPTFQFINLEQDLGNLDLRKAKQAYQPDKLAAKLRIYYNIS